MNLLPLPEGLLYIRDKASCKDRGIFARPCRAHLSRVATSVLQRTCQHLARCLSTLRCSDLWGAGARRSARVAKKLMRPRTRSTSAARQAAHDTATLTIDLSEAPRPQAAYRLAADCPRCGAPLVLRQNRQTGALFTGCSAYPGCAFAEPVWSKNSNSAFPQDLGLRHRPRFGLLAACSIPHTHCQVK